MFVFFQFLYCEILKTTKQKKDNLNADAQKEGLVSHDSCQAFDYARRAENRANLILRKVKSADRKGICQRAIYSRGDLPVLRKLGDAAAAASHTHLRYNNFQWIIP